MKTAKTHNKFTRAIYTQSRSVLAAFWRDQLPINKIKAPSRRIWQYRRWCRVFTATIGPFSKEYKEVDAHNEKKKARKKNKSFKAVHIPSINAFYISIKWSRRSWPCSSFKSCLSFSWNRHQLAYQWLPPTYNALQVNWRCKSGSRQRNGRVEKQEINGYRGNWVGQVHQNTWCIDIEKFFTFFCSPSVCVATRNALNLHKCTIITKWNIHKTHRIYALE